MVDTYQLRLTKQKIKDYVEQNGPFGSMRSRFRIGLLTRLTPAFNIRLLTLRYTMSSPIAY